MDEKKWISPHLLAGYGLATWIGYHAMEKVAIAFSDLGSANGLSIGGFTGTWGHMASSSLFVPCVCVLSVVPLIIKLVSYVPHSWKMKASVFRGVADEIEEDSSEQLVDPYRKVVLSQDAVFSTSQDSSSESGWGDGKREESVSQMADVVLLADEKRKKRKVHRR